MISLIRFIKKFANSFCPVLLCAILLSSWGCLAIYNASLQFPQPEYYALKQCTWLLIGIALALGLYRVKSEWIFKSIPWLYVIGVLSLLLVMFAGHTHNHMKGWFHTGWFSIQPSEFCKPVFCLALCWFCHTRKNGEESELVSYLKYLGLAAPFIILVALQPDFGTTLIYLVLTITIYAVFGGKRKYLGFTVLGSIPAFILILYKYPYVWRRLQGFWNPEAHSTGAGFHLIQLERSLASGGFWGQSLGKGLWSQGYLPLTHNDSIFASFCEAVGFVGGFALILVFIIALYASNKKRARMQNSLYGNSLFILVFCITFQAFIHISVNVQLLPPTGITLPFFSYGGSSLISSFLIVGFCKSIIDADRKERRLLKHQESSEVQPLEKNFDALESGSIEKIEIAG
ncbi:MAG: FtsW/RodA/SpoVE family cell cycle protein [Lentisphaeraceae bacterium]|nr:FtsW/RodA/SpoVE family cell cycle protein [Lentisphaeraceae bacterium]